MLLKVPGIRIGVLNSNLAQIITEKKTKDLAQICFTKSKNSNINISIIGGPLKKLLVLTILGICSNVFGQSLSNSSWKFIPGSEMDSVYIPEVDDQWQIRLGKWGNAWRNIQHSWNGAVCANDRLYVIGGGHNDSPHNGVLSVDPKTGIWERESEPSGLLWGYDIPCENGVCNAPHGPCPITYKDNGTPMPACGEMYDGKPTSRHTYYYLAADTNYIYMTYGGLFPGGTGGPSPTAWKFDLSTKVWDVIPDPNQSQAHGHLQIVGNILYLFNSKGYGWTSLDLDTYTWNPVSKPISPTVSGIVSHVYVPTTDSFYFFGNTESRYMTRSNYGKMSIPIPNPPAGELIDRYIGATYYPPENLILYWNGGSDITTLDPVTLVWGSVSPIGNPGDELKNGTMGRFSYCANQLILVNGVDKPMYYVEAN